MRLLIYSLGLVLFVLGTLKLLVLFVEPRLVFYPTREIWENPADFGFEYREFEVPTSDGERLSGWLIPNSASEVDIIFFHGNAGNLSTGRLDLLLSLVRQGYSLFVFDYRGYGKSSGSPDEEGFYRDAEAATQYYWSHLHQPGKTVVYFGRSLGGVAAARATQTREPDGLILEAAFPDKRSLVGSLPLLFRLLSVFSTYQLPTAAFLSEIRCPVLVLHGDRDDIIPYRLGKSLYDGLKTEKRFLTISGASHNDQYIVGEQTYFKGIAEFIEGLD